MVGKFKALLRFNSEPTVFLSLGSQILTWNLQIAPKLCPWFIPAAFTVAGSRVKLLPWRLFPKSSETLQGPPLSLLFKEAFVPLFPCFQQRELCLILWRHGEINKDLRIPPGLWSSDSEIYYSDPYPFFPLYHIVTSTIVLWTLLFLALKDCAPRPICVCLKSSG